MRTLTFIHYFFYLALNWNFRIAIHILIQEIKGEKKYGIKTIGVDNLRNSGVDFSNATIYMPASYDLLEDIFTILPAKERNHFLDIGCGKGRALFVAANYGYKKNTGIDFSKKLCDAAVENTTVFQQRKPDATFEVINIDAVDYIIPADVDCIFMFNPFNELVMKRVVENIVKNISQYKRELYIVYANPLFKDLFIKKAFTEIHYSKRLKYLEVSILKMNA